jgi:hypothetical protein
MVRPIAAVDGVKLMGASPVARIDRTAEELARRVGLVIVRDPSFLPGMGVFDFFEAETDAGVVFSVASAVARPRPSTVFAHSIADVPAIAAALAVPPREVSCDAEDALRPWLVVRRVEAGERVVLNRCMDERTAHRAAIAWARRSKDSREVVLVEPADPARDD